MNDFSVEIISCENGYIILEGSSASRSLQYAYERKKWVCEDEVQLGKLITELAEKALMGNKL